jgi:hypothetical protein
VSLALIRTANVEKKCYFALLLRQNVFVFVTIIPAIAQNHWGISRIIAIHRIDRKKVKIPCEIFTFFLLVTRTVSKEKSAEKTATFTSWDIRQK